MMELQSQVPQVAHLSLQAFPSFSAMLCTLFSSLKQLSWETQPRKQIVSQAVTMTAQQGFSALCICTEFSKPACSCYKLTSFLLSNTAGNTAFETREAFSLLKKKKKKTEVVTENFVQYLHIQNTREKCWPCCCTWNLLAGQHPTVLILFAFEEGIIIETAVIIIKIQAIKWGMLHLMKFHLIQKD